MNERIRLLAEQARESATTRHPVSNITLCVNSELFEQKFAELIVQECSSLLFNESERLYAYSTECDNMRESAEAEVVAEKCVDLIAMFEEHFGVE